MQNQIGQLEKLVLELMGKTDKGRSESVSRHDIGPDAAMTPPSDLDEVNEPENVVPMSDTFGRISLEQTGTSYVENNHWSAILDGVSIMSASSYDCD